MIKECSDAVVVPQQRQETTVLLFHPLYCQQFKTVNIKKKIDNKYCSLGCNK